MKERFKMTVKELKEKLNKYDDNAPILYYDPQDEEEAPATLCIKKDRQGKVIKIVIENGNYC